MNNIAALFIPNPLKQLCHSKCTPTDQRNHLHPAYQSLNLDDFTVTKGPLGCCSCIDLVSVGIFISVYFQSAQFIVRVYLFLVEIMSKPESIKIDPWTDFPRLAYTFINDDFVHEKLAVFKVAAKGGRSTVNIKASVSKDKGAAKVSDELKLWFDLPEGRSLYSKLKADLLRVQFDNGVTEHWGKKWNLYAGLNSSKALENVSLRLGAANISNGCHSDNRLRIDLHAEGKTNATWYNRTVVTRDRFTFGLLGALGLTSNVLVKNNVLLGYKVDDNTSTFLRLENKDFRSTGFNWADAAGYFDHLKLDVVSKFNDIKFGAEGIFNTRGSLFSEALLSVEHNNPNNKLTTKVRVSSKLNASLLFKFPNVLFKDMGKTSVGLHVNDLASDKRTFKYGVQVELDV